jgi:hypothetical protein
MILTPLIKTSKVCKPRQRKHFRGFLTQISFGDFVLETWIFSQLHCIFCEELLSDRIITNLPIGLRYSCSSRNEY